MLSSARTCSGGMGRSYNRAKIVRIFNAVQHHDERRAGEHIVKLCVLLRKKRAGFGRDRFATGSI